MDDGRREITELSLDRVPCVANDLLNCGHSVQTWVCLAGYWRMYLFDSCFCMVSASTSLELVSAARVIEVREVFCYFLHVGYIES